MTQARVMDLNSDMGENAGDDAALLDVVTSANVACGAHAGDEATMAATIEAAAARGVAIGAHPSYPDRENFGRVSMRLPPDEVTKIVGAQLAVLAGVAKRCGARLSHVKPHGALYNDAARDPDLARAVAAAIARFDPRLIVMGLAGSAMLEAAESLGLRAAGEGFCDRAYDANGSLRSRTLPGAVYDDPATAARQAVEIAVHGRARAHDGTAVSVAALTLCVHADTPNAPAIARAVRSALGNAGIRVSKLA